MKRAFVLDAAIGTVVGLLLGWGLGSRLDAVASFAREGPRIVLGKPLMFTAVFGGLAGWGMAALAEHITAMTGWMPATAGVLAAGTSMVIAALFFAGGDELGILALFAGVFFVGGLAGVAVHGRCG